MAKYKKREDGRYQANIFTHIDETTKARKFETVYAYSIPDLDNKKAEIKDRVNKGIYSNDKGLTVGKWADKWFLTNKANEHSKTKEMYQNIVYKHIIPSLGDIRLKELVKSDIQLMINKAYDTPRTCQQIRMTINQILEGAIDDGLIYKNVCKDLTMPKYKAAEKDSLPNIVNKALDIAVLTDKEKAYVYIIRYCGLRRGEALALMKNDIDIENKKLTVSKALVIGTNKIDKTKTISGMRTISMPKIVADFLKGYIDTLKGLYLFEMERKGGLMTKSSYDKFWGKIVKKLNEAVGGTEKHKVIKGLGAHAFRHDYATMLYYAGISAKEAQYMLGHSDILITLNIYTHLDKNKSDAVSKIDAYLAQ